MYKDQGWRGIYAGCGMTVARAIPCSGTTFVVYDGPTQKKTGSETVGVSETISRLARHDIT